MTTKTVEFEISVPNDVNEDDLLEFLNFFLQIRGGIELSNPLSEVELDYFNPKRLSIS